MKRYLLSLILLSAFIAGMDTVCLTTKLNIEGREYKHVNFSASNRKTIQYILIPDEFAIIAIEVAEGGNDGINIDVKLLEAQVTALKNESFSNSQAFNLKCEQKGAELWSIRLNFPAGTEETLLTEIRGKQVELTIAAASHLE